MKGLTKWRLNSIQMPDERRDKMIIPIYGVLTKRPYDDFEESISYEEIYDKICQGLENPNVEEIILDIDSPGGETGGLFDLCDFIYEARSRKPIIAYANDSCFSAGYAIASSCSKVLVTRTSGVGSIGVIATHVSQLEFNKKEGFNFTTIFKGARKNDLNPNEEISPEAAENLDLELDRLYQMFVNLVARNRNLPVSKIIETEAGVFYGEDAIAIGLADELTTCFKVDTFKVEKNMDMNLETKTETENKNEEILEEIVEKSDDYKSEITEITRLCKLAKMPEKLAEFVESGTSLADARDLLMKSLANKNNDIRSTITAGTNMSSKLESPVIAAARARLY